MAIAQSKVQISGRTIRTSLLKRMRSRRGLSLGAHRDMFPFSPDTHFFARRGLPAIAGFVYAARPVTAANPGKGHFLLPIYRSRTSKVYGSAHLK
jgi:hypothetical protein